jgi:hypothetical protein
MKRDQDTLQLHDGENDLTIETNIELVGATFEDERIEHRLTLETSEGGVLEFWFTDDQKADIINLLSN